MLYPGDKPKITSAEKKNLFIDLLFKADSASEILMSFLNVGISCTFTTGKLRCYLNIHEQEEIPYVDRIHDNLSIQMYLWHTASVWSV